MRILAGLLSCLLSLGAFAASVTATWEHNGQNVDGFRLRYECPSKVGEIPATPTARSLSFEAPTGERCRASILAFNSFGSSAPSNIVEFVPGATGAPGAVTSLRVSWQRTSEPDRMSLSFDGTNDNAVATISGGSVPPITMAAWVKAGNLTNNVAGDVILQLGQSGQINQHHRLQIGNGVTVCAVAHTRALSGVEAVSSTAIANTTDWNHVAGVWASESSRAAFLNGGGKGTETTSVVPTAANINRIRMGERTDGGQDFQGKIAHAAIWVGAALSDAEIAELAAGANPLDYYPESLFAYYPGELINISGTNYLEDVSGNARHLTISGAVYDSDAPDVDPPGGGTTVDAGVEGITLSTFSAAISTDRAISGQQEALTLSTYGAAIALGAAIDTSLEQLVLSTLPAELSIGLNAAAEQITLGTFLAAVALDRTITGSLESILLQTNPAAVSVGAAIAGQTEHLVLQTQPAQVALDISLDAQLQQIVLTSLSAQIGLAQNIDANIESLTLTTHGATLTLDSGLSAQLEVLMLQTYLASISSALPEFDSPGLQYTLAGDRAHYTLPVSRLHFTFRS